MITPNKALGDMRTAISKPQIYFEAVLLAGPLTVVTAFLGAVALGLGVPALLWTMNEPKASYEIPLTIAIITFPVGAYALLQLWLLVRATAENRSFPFNARFWVAAAFSVAAACVLIYIYRLFALAIVLPAYVLGAHMAFIQRRHVAQGAPGDGPRPAGSSRA